MKVLHINDVARIGTHLVRCAQAHGYDWELYDIARTDPDWNPHTRLLRKAIKGGFWEAGYVRRALRADLVNIHGGNVQQHTRWLRRPFVLHLHGSDVRTVRLQEKQGKIIDQAIDEALQVYYTTPDLTECTLPLRSDATLQPVIVDVNEVPESTAPPVMPTVIFPSRWGPEKGGELQLKVAEQLRRALGSTVRFQGLQWGSNADRAAKLGIELLPRMDHAQYVQWISTATCAVGQLRGVIAVSELEVVATGVPVIAPLRPSWYALDHPTTRNVPVYVGVTDENEWVDAICTSAQQLVAEPIRTNARGWVAEHHGPEVAVQRLRKKYAQLNL